MARVSDLDASERAIVASGVRLESQSTNSSAVEVRSLALTELKSSGELTAMMRSTLPGCCAAK